MRLAALLAVVLSGCASTDFNITTSIDIVDQNAKSLEVSPEKFNRIKASVDAHLALFHQQEGLSDTHFRIKVYLPSTNWETTYLNYIAKTETYEVVGTYILGEIHVSGDAGDSVGSLYHELFHKKLDDTTGDPDGQHTHPKWPEIERQGRALRNMLRLIGPQVGVSP